MLDGAVWLPDRGDVNRASLVLREVHTGHLLRRVAAPDLSGPGTGLTADRYGPNYVRTINDQPVYSYLCLAR